MQTRPENISEEIEKEFQAYALTQLPNEACALVIKGKLVPVKNISKEPKDTFILGKRDSARALTAQAFLHSHPNGKPVPSAADMESQIAYGIPFGLIGLNETGTSAVVWWGDHLLDLPLDGRKFIDGVTDCYSIIRAGMWQDKGIKIRDYPRYPNWHLQGSDLYNDGLRDGDWVEVDDLQPYDMILMKIGSKVPNHAALYLGDGKIVHHLTHRDSTYDVLVRYAKLVDKVVRYVGKT